MFRVNVILVFLTLNIFHTFLTVSTFDFEQVNNYLGGLVSLKRKSDRFVTGFKLFRRNFVREMYFPPDNAKIFQTRYKICQLTTNGRRNW